MSRASWRQNVMPSHPGKVLLSPDTLQILKDGTNPKGDPLEIARIAGIMAGKKTSDLIPLCHQINLTKVDVRIVLTAEGASIESEAKTVAETGVEMEALTAASVAALTIYDMCKAVDKGMIIGDIRVTEKRKE